MFDPLRYGGLVNDLAVHDLDLARLFGGVTGTVASGTVTAVARASRSDPAGFVRPTAGLAVVGYQSHPSLVEMGAEKFNQYLKEEGLDAIAALDPEMAEVVRR